MSASSKDLKRNCLVTVGATVGFEELTKAVLQPAFWEYLRSQGFTALRIQCGPDIAWASTELSSRAEDVPSGMTVDVFERSKNLMKDEMTLCKPVLGQRRLGLVISHAGIFIHLFYRIIGLTTSRDGNDTGCVEAWPSDRCRAQHKITQRPPDRTSRAP